MLDTNLTQVVFTNLLGSVVWTVGTDAFENLSQNFDCIKELFHIFVFKTLLQLWKVNRKLCLHFLKNYIYDILF